MNKLGLITGLIWGWIGLSVGIFAFSPIIFGGLVISPLIGLTFIKAVPLFERSSKLLRIVISFLALVVGAATFGLGVGIADLIFGPPGRISWAVVAQGAYVMVWGLLFLNFIFVGLLFWPASYFTLVILGRKISEQKR